MKIQFDKTCPQTQRALRMLVTPSAPKIDRIKLIAALPGPTPADPKELLDLIIQIVLALLENKDGDKPEKDKKDDGIFDELRRVAKEAATETIPPATLKQDVPKIVASIRSIAAIIPTPGFPSLRVAREAMRVANNEALDQTIQTWLKWNAAIHEEMDNLDFDEKLNGEAQYKQAWLAIAQALETIL